jgi:hypothetical protein
MVGDGVESTSPDSDFDDLPIPQIEVSHADGIAHSADGVGE